MNVTQECAVRNSGLPGTTTELYKTLMGYCHGTKSKCFPGVRHIMGMTNRSRRTVQIHLRRLEEAGLIITKHRTGYGGRYTSNEYVVVELMDEVRKQREGEPRPPLKKTDRHRSSAKSKSENRRPPGDTCSSVDAQKIVSKIKTRLYDFSKPPIFAHAQGHGLRHYEVGIELYEKTSDMFLPSERDSLLVEEAAEIGHVYVVLANPTRSNPKPKPAPVESLASPVPVLSTVHENRPPAQPAPKPAAPTRTVAPQKPAQPQPAPQTRPVQPQTAPQAKPAQPAPTPELTPTASPQAFAPRPAEPRPPQKVRTEPAKAFERYEIQGEFNTIETLVRTFHEFVEKGWRVYSEDSFIAWVETWCSVAAKSKPIVPEKKRIRNPKGYLVRLVKEGLDRTVIRQANVKKAQQVKIDIRAQGLYPSF